MLKENKAGKILYLVEQRRNLHCTSTFTMNHEVDGALLQKALDDTLKVYPLVNQNLVFEDGKLYFAPNAHKAEVIHLDGGITPGSERLNGHQFYVTYFENRIRVCVSHGITDGGGFFEFGNTLVHRYLCEKEGRNIYAPAVRKIEDGAFEDDLIDFYTLDFNDSLKENTYQIESACYTLPEAISKGENIVSILTVDESDFIALTKKYASSVSVFVFYLIAKAIYALRSDASSQNIMARITVNARNILGLPHNQLNCSLGAHLSLCLEDTGESKTAQTLAWLKQSLKEQLSQENIVHDAAVLAATGQFKSELHPTVSISYMGKVDLGEMNQLIDDFSIIEGEFHKINLFSYNGRMKLFFHLGAGSFDYANAVRKILAEHNIDSQVTENIILAPEA